MKEVDFSNLIFVDGGGFLIRSDSSINGFGDLAGKSVAVTAGTTTEKRLNDMLRIRLVNAKVVTVKDGVEGVAMLESGAVAAFASDKIRLIGLAGASEESQHISRCSPRTCPSSPRVHGAAQRFRRSASRSTRR